MDETDRPRAGEARSGPTCPICQATGFDQERGRLDSQWGVTTHQVVMLICQGCGYVLLFTAGRSIFDFD